MSAIDEDARLRKSREREREKRQERKEKQKKVKIKNLHKLNFSVFLSSNHLW
jgi:hypothetical protein